MNHPRRDPPRRERVIGKIGAAWYAETWQKKFHYFSNGASLCGQYYLRHEIPAEQFEHTHKLPITCRCLVCERVRKRASR